MSADKNKGLATRAAYLRLASREGGLGLNIKWAARLTPFLMRMMSDDEIVLRRMGSTGTGGKAVTHAFATDKGIARLAALEQRYGSSFGSRADIDRIEPCRETKTMRRIRRLAPETLRANAQNIRARRQAAYQRATLYLTCGLSN